MANFKAVFKNEYDVWVRVSKKRYMTTPTEKRRTEMYKYMNYTLGRYETKIDYFQFQGRIKNPDIKKMEKVLKKQKFKYITTLTDLETIFEECK